MKKISSVFFLLFFAGLFTSLVFAENPIYIKGTWDDTYDLRSISLHGHAKTPAPPIVSIEKDILLVYFTDAVTDLTVTVGTTRGRIIYVNTISGKDGSTLPLPLGLSSGEYLLSLTHPTYGTLVGRFSIE
jgi:hypothetical protein